MLKEGEFVGHIHDFPSTGSRAQVMFFYEMNESMKVDAFAENPSPRSSLLLTISPSNPQERMKPAVWR